MADLTTSKPIDGYTAQVFLRYIRTAFNLPNITYQDLAKVFADSSLVIEGVSCRIQEGRLYNDKNQVAYIASTRGKATALLDLYCSKDRFNADFIVTFCTHDRSRFVLDLYYTFNSNPSSNSFEKYIAIIKGYEEALTCFGVIWLDEDAHYYLYNDDGIEQVIDTSEIVEIFT
jgi:hypothetical protein